MSKEEIIKADNGSCFENKDVARDVFIKKGLDPKKYAIVQSIEEGGWIIQKKESFSQVNLSRKMKAVLKDEKFLWVRLSPPSGNDLKKIPITVRGATIICARGVDICLPESYVKVLETAIEGVWENGVRYERLRCPFMIIREGTRKEFEELFSKS